MNKEEFIDWLGIEPDLKGLAIVTLEGVIAEAIAEHEASRLKIRLQQFSNFLEHRYTSNASGIPFKKAIEIYLERIFSEPYQKGGLNEMA